LLLDERPKYERNDLFDRDKEIQDMESNMNRPLIVISGVRRIGKTSLLQVVLNESRANYIVIDCRRLKENYGRQDLYSLFSNSFTSVLDKIKDLLKGVKGVSIVGNSVEFKWRGRDSLTLGELFDHLDKRRTIIAIDEAQRLRGPLSGEIKDAMAHAYDYDRNVTFVLTGSEVGLLYDFLGVEDERSPLFGRYYYSLVLDRFDRGKSEEFLRKGFEEKGVKLDGEVEKLIEVFDGIPGWLTYGANRLLEGRRIEEIREMAVRVAQGELNRLLQLKRQTSEISARRYKYVLRCIANGERSWSGLLRCVERSEGSTVSSSALYNVIKNLESMSIVKDYEYLDPIYEEASRRL